MTLEPRLAECSSCKRINTAPEGCLATWSEVPAYCGACRKVVTHRLLRLRATATTLDRGPSSAKAMRRSRIE